MDLNRNMTYFEFVDFLIDEMTEYERISNDEWKYANEMIKKVGSNGDASMCEDIELIFEAIDKNVTDIDNSYSAHNLSKILTISIVRLSKKGYLNYSMRFMDFLRKDLFKQLISNSNTGIAMIRGVYRGCNLDNTPVYENGIFYNIFGQRKPEDGAKIMIDTLFLSKTFADFFLRMDKNNYFSEDDRKFLEETITDYNNFRLYADTDQPVLLAKYRDPTRKYSKKIPDHYTYEKEADKLRKKYQYTWPAMGYALAEAYHHYELRVSIAKLTVPKAKVECIRGSEEYEYKRHKEFISIRNALLKLIITIAVLGFVILKVHALFTAHPEYLGFTAIIVVGFMLLTAINPFTLIFYWLFGD